MGDEELRAKLDLLYHGDRAAFEAIYREMITPVFTVILRITQDRTLTEDIVQEFFVKLFYAPPKPPIQKPRAYLFRMAHNLAIDSMRQQPQDAALEDYTHLTHTVLDRTEKLDVESALQTLSSLDRQIVVLHINGGLKFRELAEIMAMPLGTVLWRYQRAIGRLRSNLDGGAL